MKGHKDFKIIFIPALGEGNNIELEQEYDTLNDAAVALNAIADYTLLLHRESLMRDYSNMGMIFKNGLHEWVEIDDDGLEI